MSTTIEEYAAWVPTRWLSTGAAESLTLRDLFIMATGLAGESGETLEALDEFQDAFTTFLVNEAENGLGLARAVGKMEETLKKSVRDDKLTLEKLKKEVGDVLYYLVMICHMHNINITEVLEKNMGKVDDRHVRGVVHGSGDDR